MSLRPVVSEKIRDKEYFLKGILYAKSAKKRQFILHHAGRGEIMALAEVVANVLIGNIDILNSERFPLYWKKKALFRTLGFAGRISWKKRLQAALKLGRVLVFFLADVLPTVT